MSTRNFCWVVKATGLTTLQTVQIVLKWHAQACVERGGVYDASNIVLGVIRNVIKDILTPFLLPIFR
jgi:hypothetical protein